jgi:hypothetical protein
MVSTEQIRMCVTRVLDQGPNSRVLESGLSTSPVHQIKSQAVVKGRERFINVSWTPAGRGKVSTSASWGTDRTFRAKQRSGGQNACVITEQ